MGILQQDDKAEIPWKARGMRFLAYCSLVVVFLLPRNLSTQAAIEFGQVSTSKKDANKRMQSEENHTKQRYDPLEMSTRHQTKFERQAPLVEAAIPLEKRYTANTGVWAVINLKGTPYAYYHIWKSGGSTVAAQTQKRHHGRNGRPVRHKRWVTAVRDPIDHFLSGWAECGDREFQKGKKKKNRQELLESYQQPYDLRILSWLKQVQQIAVDGAQPVDRMHSIPQANFLLKDGRIVPQLDRVGDMRELPILMKSIGFAFQESIQTTRNATENEFKNKYFPRRRDLLSDNTTRALCDFVALDYFLFDFVPPPVCQKQLEY